jgi:ABC-type lipoprotein export system ATPase subunit
MPFEPALSAPTLISVKGLTKIFNTPAGDFPALQGIDLEISQGEFVAVIGRSGSGKSTFINMLSGIDTPSSGEIFIGGEAIHEMSEDKLAAWRGLRLGIIFQFFQLLPTLTLRENVILPMELNDYLTPAEREVRAKEMLDLVGMAEHMDKLPSKVSGGQQQRAAIARALVNDPPLLIADEPTGNLDTKTAEEIFQLFERLVQQGKTIVMVTHDDTLARRVDRTILISDGEVVNEYLVKALSLLPKELLEEVSQFGKRLNFGPGDTIIRQGELGQAFYVLLEGEARVYIQTPANTELQVNILRPGQYFGEMALIESSPTTATVLAASDSPVSVVALTPDQFDRLLEKSALFREQLQEVAARYRIRQRIDELAAIEGKGGLFEEGESLTFSPGELIFRQGSQDKSLYLIQEGSVDIVSAYPGQPECRLNELRRGDYFGETGLWGDPRRTASVTVSGDVPAKVLRVSEATVARLLKETGTGGPDAEK